MRARQELSAQETCGCGWIRSQPLSSTVGSCSDLQSVQARSLSMVVDSGCSLRWHALLVSSHRGSQWNTVDYNGPLRQRFLEMTADPALIDIKNRKSRQAVAFFSTMQQLRPWLCTHSLVPYSSSSGHFQYPATVARDLPILGASVVM